MKKFITLLFAWIYPIISYGTIDECKTDVYFANGILTDRIDAVQNMILLEKSIRKDIYGNNEDEMYKHIGEVGYAYNHTYGQVPDLLESMLQKLEWHWLTDFFSPSHGTDVSTQVTKYKDSIKNGHKVLVVAHSQGNLFTYDAYKALGEESRNGWMQKYFEAISIASPMRADIKQGTLRIDWDNDTVPHIYTSGDNNSNDTYNKVRKISWVQLDGTPNDDSTSTVLIPPLYGYTNESNIGKIYEIFDGYQTIRYKAQEGGMDSNVHAFTFYMGKVIKDGDTGLVFQNPFGDLGILAYSAARTKIMNEIETKLRYVLPFKPSQWKPKNLGCLCKDKYAEMTHKFDPALMDIRLEDEKVKDFAEGVEGKIYSVIYKGEQQYVRARCGGEVIIDIIDSDEVCYKLEDNESLPFGTIEGDPEQNLTLPDGLFTSQLYWNETIVKMEMSNSLMSESMNGCGFATLGSGDLELNSVYPGTYPINVTAEGYEDLDDTDLSDEVRLKIEAVTEEKYDVFTVTKKYQYPNLGKGGHLADIIITRPRPYKTGNCGNHPSLRRR